MTKEETNEVLNKFASEFPSIRSMNATERQTKFKLWYDTFKNVPAQIVNHAISQEMISSHSGFAPTIGQVINRILESVTADPETESSDAWNTIIRFVHNYSQDDYRNHFDELPEKIKMLISVPDLRAIANNSPEQNHNFEKPRFMAQYKTVKERYDRQMIAQGRIDLIADPGKMKLIGFGNGK